MSYPNGHLNGLKFIANGHVPNGNINITENPQVCTYISLLGFKYLLDFSFYFTDGSDANRKLILLLYTRLSMNRMTAMAIMTTQTPNRINCWTLNGIQ